MKNNISSKSMSLFLFLISSFQTFSVQAVDGIAYYSDFTNNRVFAIDPIDFSVKAIIATNQGPYPVDKTNDEKSYVSTRNAYSIDVINNNDLTFQTTIPLNHKPRSPAYNKANGLALVSGGDKPLTSVIKVKKDKVKKVVGRNILVNVTDNGGSLATGHPYWVNKKRFLLLDRAARTISLYSKKGKLKSVLSTSSSVHHVIKSQLPGQENIYYASVEGSQLDGIYPGLLKFKIENNKQLIDLGMVNIGEAQGTSPAIMSAHHADFHPDGIHVYQGSAEGNTYVINTQSMTVVKVINTGKGAGHTRFAPAKGVAIVTNHNDTFISVIDTDNHSLIKNIPVASASLTQKTQAHTSSLSPDQQYYYGMASADGKFYELNLSKNPAELNITRQLDLEALYGDVYTLQGTFIWQL